MRITKMTAVRTCAVCERSLLMGERATRFQPYPGAELVEVCPLCIDEALEHGWVKEGSPTSPAMPTDRRRRRSGLSRLFDMGHRDAQEPIVSEPILRRLSEREQAMVEAADLFNASDHRRTAAANAKALGHAKVSIVPLSGVSGELIVTVVWDISWYQYRVSPDSAQPVRLAERGEDPSDLESAYTVWNARLDEYGRVLPEIAKV